MRLKQITSSKYEIVILVGDNKQMLPPSSEGVRIAMAVVFYK